MENQEVNNNVANEPMDNSTEQVEKTFTQADVDRLLQSETDRRVNQAKAKWEKEYASKLAEEKRLSQLSAEERQREIQEAEAKKFQQERDEFEKARAEFARQKMELELVKELEAEGLPVSFSSFLLGADTEATFANMQAFKTEYNNALQKAVEKHVEEKLRGTQPVNGNQSNKMMTKKEFARLPYKERQKLMDENPELIEQLFKQN